MMSSRGQPEAADDDLADSGDAISFSSSMRKTQSTLVASVFNLLNTMIGAGILALPFVISRMGMLIGGCVFLMVALSNTFTMYVMMRSIKLSKCCDFEGLALLCTGRFGEALFKIVLILGNFATKVVYLTVFSTSMSQMALTFFDSTCSASQFLCGRTFFLLCSTLVTVQFAFKKTTEKLKLASLIGVSLHLVFCAILFYAFFRMLLNGEIKQVEYFAPGISLKQGIQLLPTVFGAFACQINFYPVVACLKTPSEKNIMKLVHISMAFGFFLYLAVGLAAYSCFGTNTKGNIVESFTLRDLGTVLFYIFNFSVGLPILFVFPMFFFMSRDYILQFSRLWRHAQYEQIQTNEPRLYDTEPRREDRDRPDLAFPGRLLRIALLIFNKGAYPQDSGIIHCQTKALFKLTSLLYLAAILIVSIFLQDYFLEVFNIGSMVTQTFTGFVYPIAFYLRLETNKGKLYYFSILFLVFVTSLNIVSLVCLF